MVGEARSLGKSPMALKRVAETGRFAIRARSRRHRQAAAGKA
jgi:hypothetical protein